LEGLLAGVAVVAAAVVVVVVFVLVVVTDAVQVTAVTTDFKSWLLLLYFRFLDRATASDVDVVVTFATGFSV
jgi:hypothetical protein